MEAVGTTNVSTAINFIGMTIEVYMRITIVVTVSCLAAWVLSRFGTMTARRIGSWFTGVRTLLVILRSCHSVAPATPVRLPVRLLGV